MGVILSLYEVSGEELSRLRMHCIFPVARGKPNPVLERAFRAIVEDRARPTRDLDKSWAALATILGKAGLAGGALFHSDDSDFSCGDYDVTLFGTDNLKDYAESWAQVTQESLFFGLNWAELDDCYGGPWDASSGSYLWGYFEVARSFVTAAAERDAALIVGISA